MATSDQITEQLAGIRKMIVDGSVPQARLALRKLCERKLPRKCLEEVVDLTRMADMPMVGVRLLHKIVRPPRGSVVKASPLELSMYAAALNEAGGTREASALLNSIDPEQTHYVYFFKALAHIWAWNWSAAVPELEGFIAHSKTSATARVAGKVWLAGALLYGPENYQRSRILLEEVLRASNASRGRYPHKRALEFLAQVYFFQRNWSMARKTLDRLEALSSEERDFYYSLIVRQWRCMISLFDPGAEKSPVRLLTNIREEFKANGKWEEARRCDYFRALCLRDRELLIHVYYGSPYAGLRTKIETQLGGRPRIPEHYEWRIAPKSAPVNILEVATGKYGQGGVQLKSGQLPQRLLEALCSDLYSPMQLTRLHELLYPNEYFNADSSPDRVHQAFLRLRQWINKNKVPLQIEERDGFFSLQPLRGLVLRMDADPAKAKEGLKPVLSEKFELRLGTLAKKFAAKDFTAHDAARCLRVSYRSAINYVNLGVEQGLFERVGSGPATRYRSR